ncbi:tail fiber domain-containing protein [Parasedimentitalea marina]|uniref:tail fiber domain-containing protein n=1 Tax=Parasedimentitalea marina TaxID=2483033 RepID=UPI0030841A89
MLNDAEKRVAASLKTSNRIYQWIDAVEAKGEDKARLHCVFIAQDIQAGLFQRFGHP